MNAALPAQVELSVPTSRRERWPVAIGFLAGLLMLAAIAFYGARENAAAREARGRVTEAYEILARTLEIEASVILMEARHRAFLISGEIEFERRRDTGHAETVAGLAGLREQLDNDPSLGLPLEALEQAIEERYTAMREASRVAHEVGMEQARANFDPFGSASIDPIRTQLRDLRTRQRRLLDERHALSELRAQQFDRVLVYGTALAVALLVVAGWTLHRQLLRGESDARKLDRLSAVQRTMLDAGGMLTVAVRPDGVVRLFNRAAADALGYRADEVIGRHTLLLFHDEQEIAARALELTEEIGEPVAGSGVFTALPRRGRTERREWTWVRKDGSRFPVEMAVTALRDAAGHDHGYIAMALDLSARRAAEQAVTRLNANLRAKAEALEEANGELEAFSYSVSHDLRAPLRHIDGYARILGEEAGEQLAPELQHYLQRIGYSARRMGSLIEDLLSFSRLSRTALQPQRVAMATLAQDALNEAQVGAASIEIGDLPEVAGDPSLLRQIWVNLLANALKYSAPRGADAQVVLAGWIEGDRAVFEVADNGVGFDMRYRDRLFGVFQRLHSQDEFEGTGIGLAIVHRVVRRHGGRVDACSVPGEGATFRFELPLEWDQE